MAKEKETGEKDNRTKALEKALEKVTEKTREKDLTKGRALANLRVVKLAENPDFKETAIGVGSGVTPNPIAARRTST